MAPPRFLNLVLNPIPVVTQSLGNETEFMLTMDDDGDRAGEQDHGIDREVKAR